MPGPGSHNVPIMFEDTKYPASNIASPPSFSMSSGWRDETPRKDKVGPGKYQSSIDATKRRSPGWGFSHQKRLLSEPHKTYMTASPDLGQQDNLKYNRSPRYGFGCTNRLLPHDRLVERARKDPGPGQTNPEDRSTSKWTASPSFCIASPRAAPREETNNPKTQKIFGPGPGAYNVEPPEAHTAKKNPYYTFSSSARLADDPPTPRVTTPGPGAYVTLNATRTGQNCLGDGAPRWSMPGRAELDVAALA